MDWAIQFAFYPSTHQSKLKFSCCSAQQSKAMSLCDAEIANKKNKG